MKVDIFLNLTQTLLQTSVPQKIPSPPVATTPSGMQTTLHLSGTPVNRTKREVRGRNKELEEDLKQLDQQIMFKEKRRDQAETIRNYKLCDELTEDVGKLKTARREAFNELKQFQRKEKRARWYHEKKRRSSAEKRPRKSSGSGGIFSDSDTPLESPSSVATDATIILSDSGSEMESGHSSSSLLSASSTEVVSQAHSSFSFSSGACSLSPPSGSDQVFSRGLLARSSSVQGGPFPY